MAIDIAVAIYVVTGGPRFMGVEPIHSQPFITSNRPKLGIDFGLHLLILATFDPSSNILRVGFHDRPP